LFWTTRRKKGGSEEKAARGEHPEPLLKGKTTQGRGGAMRHEKLNATKNGAAQAICAELSGDDQCRALGIVAISPSPVLLLCRKLIATGVDPATPIEVWRHDVPCLSVRSLGEAAGLRVNSAGTGFVPLHAPPTASLARLGGKNEGVCLAGDTNGTDRRSPETGRRAAP
jgi:hypothetical protein